MNPKLRTLQSRLETINRIEKHAVKIRQELETLIPCKDMHEKLVLDGMVGDFIGQFEKIIFEEMKKDEESK